MKITFMVNITKFKLKYKFAKVGKDVNERIKRRIRGALMFNHNIITAEACEQTI